MKVEYFLFWKCLFALILVFSFVSCSKENRETKLVIGFSQCTGGDAWRRAMHKEMYREVSFYSDLELIIEDAGGNSQLQKEQITHLVNQRIDLLIVSPNEAEPITPAVEAAYKKGLPVIVIDRHINSDKFSSYIGADNYEIGQMAGKYAADLLKGNGKIIEVWGLTGSTPAVDRHQGFWDIISTYENIELIDSIYGQWEQTIAYRKLPEILDKHPSVDLIYAHNDVMALASYQAAKELNRQDEIRFLGVDGLAGENGGIDFVSKGILDGTLLYPTGGEEAIRLAHAILHRAPYEKEYILNSTLIDSSNVRIFKLQTDKILSYQEGIERQQGRIDELGNIYRNQQLYLGILLAILLVAIILGVLAYSSLVSKNDALRKLEAQNGEILDQRNQIMKISDQLQIASHAKVKFFTNISHELRTPLTLIIGAVETLLQNKNSGQQHKDLNLIHNNALRLLRLINQLMDFRRIENNKLQVRATENDIVGFTKEIMVSFEQLAFKREIDFRLFTREERLKVWFDVDMIDKVLFNLLSNAFKFTPDKGKIHLIIEKDHLNKKMRLAVEDNGRGMSPEHVSHAFDRYYQGESYNTQGTGLGLSLSRELIRLHQGEINLQSEKGEGTRFEIELKLGETHFLENQRYHDPIDEDFHHLSDTHWKELQETLTEDPVTVLPIEGQTLLIIEDHDELRGFLRDKLSENYIVIEAVDGNEGRQKAFEHIPNLIICDIMLPLEDGLSLTRKLKQDLRTSHIPVILLTARSTTEQQIEGIQAGADEYIMKPFNFHVLSEKIKSLLFNRELLRESFSKEIVSIKGRKDLNQLDQDFLKQFVHFVETNYSRHDFGVADLCKEIGLSRSQLYRKVKALLGQSISDFIQDFRLKKAEELLKESDLYVTEIAERVGYNSPEYFATAFKSRYHYSPTQYRSQLPSSK